MASKELQPIVDMMRSRPSYKEATIEQLREGLVKLIQQYPVPEDLQCEAVDADGVPGEWIAWPGADAGRVVYYLHGGAYVRGSVDTHRNLMGGISRYSGARMLGVDYRLGPEHPFPAAVHDALTGYGWLLTQGILPERVVIAGDSAGGGLALAVLVALRDAGDPLPAGGVLLSPWTDMEATGDSIETKAAVDPMIQRDYLLDMAKMYLGGADPRDPLASPLLAELHGLPPLLIQVGTAETLMDDSDRVAEKVTAAGGRVTLEHWDDMVHAWPLFAPVLPEGREAIEKIGAFVKGILG